MTRNRRGWEVDLVRIGGWAGCLVVWESKNVKELTKFKTAPNNRAWEADLKENERKLAGAGFDKIFVDLRSDSN